MVEVHPIIGLGNRTSLLFWMKMLIITESADLIWTFPMLSCLCLSEHNNLSDHLLHMSKDFSSFKFYHNCYFLYYKISPYPTQNINSPSTNLPWYFSAPLLWQILLCTSFMSLQKIISYSRAGMRTYPS